MVEMHYLGLSLTWSPTTANSAPFIFSQGGATGVLPQLMENQMCKKMKNEVEAGIAWLGFQNCRGLFLGFLRIRVIRL